MKKIRMFLMLILMVFLVGCNREVDYGSLTIGHII